MLTHTSLLSFLDEIGLGNFKLPYWQNCLAVFFLFFSYIRCCFLVLGTSYLDFGFRLFDGGSLIFCRPILKLRIKMKNVTIIRKTAHSHKFYNWIIQYLPQSWFNLSTHNTKFVLDNLLFFFFSSRSGIFILLISNGIEICFRRSGIRQSWFL